MKCAICKLALDPESPYYVWCPNPLTFRNASMHSDCYADALDELENEPSHKAECEDRLDEYLVKFGE